MINFFDESFVVALCFVFFIYFAYRPVKKAIVASLDARIDEIKTKLAETEELKKDAKLLLDEIKQEMQVFEERKSSILENADTVTQRLVEIRTKEMELMLARKKDLVIKSIDNQKERASDQMRIEFTDTVLKTVRTYLIETKNNAISDEKIISLLLKK